MYQNNNSSRTYGTNNYLQKCFPSKKEAIIKENEFVDNENNNTKLNSDNEGSKNISILYL